MCLQFIVLCACCAEWWCTNTPRLGIRCFKSHQHQRELYWQAIGDGLSAYSTLKGGRRNFSFLLNLFIFCALSCLVIYAMKEENTIHTSQKHLEHFEETERDKN